MILLRSLLLALLALLAVPAWADKADDALARFASDKFADTEAAIADTAAAGLPTASAILEALAASRLLYSPADKALY